MNAYAPGPMQYPYSLFQANFLTFGLLGAVVEVLGFKDAAFDKAFFGGIFFAAGVKTGDFFFGAVTGKGEDGDVGNFPPFFLDKSSGWILGRTPPEAIVTPRKSWKITYLCSLAIIFINLIKQGIVDLWVMGIYFHLVHL